ncbi:MAG TPA: hypothetical protein VGZ23_19575 [bacterium]|nr:hypothetical protein [bacterium]
MYEWLATERLASYRREAERDRRASSAARQDVLARRGGAERPAHAAAGRPSSWEWVPTRRVLAATFIGLAAIGALRRRR